MCVCVYRARKVYQEKLSRKKAVTVISAAWKGYKARKSYLYKVIRNRAATKIQTVFRCVLFIHAVTVC